MDAKESISQYWDWRSRSYTNGSHGFEEEEKAVWKMELEPFLQGGDTRESWMWGPVPDLWP